VIWNTDLNLNSKQIATLYDYKKLNYLFKYNRNWTKPGHFIQIGELIQVKCRKKKDRNHCEEEIRQQHSPLWFATQARASAATAPSLHRTEEKKRERLRHFKTLIFIEEFLSPYIFWSMIELHRTNSPRPNKRPK